MIIKPKDPILQAQGQLEALLAQSLTAKQRFLVERELSTLLAGARGEQDSAYFLDFAFGKSDNWAVIHDLRLEHAGRVSQIDHLAINRFLDIYVLETKNFFYGMKVNERGEFDIWTGKIYVGIESPLEQNQRHVAVLKQMVTDRDLAPKRLGLSIPVVYHPCVLVSPKSRVIRPGKAFNTDNILKADQFRTMLDQKIDSMSVLTAVASMGKMVSTDTLREFAQTLAALHRPIAIDYRAKFGIADEPAAPKTVDAPPQAVAPPAVAGLCDLCGAGVEAKVAAYCRFNRAKLGGNKVLCRDCQKKV